MLRCCRYLCEYAAVRILVALMQCLPERVAERMCTVGSWFLSNLLPIRRALVAENIARVFPDLPRAEVRLMRRRMWKHLLMMICEIAWAPRRLHRCNWKQFVVIPDTQQMLQNLLSPRPLVIVSGHFGNFEIGGYVTGLMGVSTVTIARKLDNPFLDGYLRKFRGGKGQWMVDKKGCAAFVDGHLENGGVLTLLADQHAGAKGCWVDFLGHPASYHKALALFALTADAPLMVSSTRRIGAPMRFQQDLFGVVDPRAQEPVTAGVRSLTTWYSDRMGEMVLLAPDQYWWLHRRWRPKPEKRQKRTVHDSAVKRDAA